MMLVLIHHRVVRLFLLFKELLVDGIIALLCQQLVAVACAFLGRPAQLVIVGLVALLNPLLIVMMMVFFLVASEMVMVFMSIAVVDLGQDVHQRDVRECAHGNQ